MRARTNKKTFFLGALFGFLALAGLLAFTLWLTTSPTLAVTVDSGLGSTLGLGTADLESTIIKILQWALGLLGLVAVIIIMYGGFVWLTAAGNEEKIKKAKRILRDAVIGLVIIMLAWAIVTFIIGRLNDIINGPGAVICSPGPPPDVNHCYECNAAGTGYTIYNPLIPGCAGGSTDTFRKTWIDPSYGEVNVPLCSIIQVIYNGDFLVTSVPGNVGLYVDAATKGDAVLCGGASECFSGVCTAGACVGGEVAGVWQVVAADHTLLEFLPDADYLPSTTYRAEIRAGVTEDAPSPRVTVPEIWTFTTGTTTLTTPPTVTKIYPTDDDAGICLMTPIQSIFSQKMRVSSINATTVLLQNPVPTVLVLGKISYPNVSSFSTRPASPLAPNTLHDITLRAGTPGGTCSIPGPGCITKSDCVNTCGGTWTYNTDGIMDVCYNHLDGNYNGADDGTAGGDNFMAVNNQPLPNPPNETVPWSFTTDTDTTNTRCIPEITGINPADGKYTDPLPYTQITGTNFGITGNVTFPREVSDVLNCFNGNYWPDQDCNVSWTGSAIQTRIPGGPRNYGDIIPSNGAKDGGVVVSISPGVCEGGADDNKSCPPSACPGGRCVTDSNASDFDVTSPQIGAVSGLNDQPHGGIGQYVTIFKRSDSNAGFGDYVAGSSRVWFRHRITGARVQALFPPNPPCDATWTDRYVIIKVPDLLGLVPVACAGDWVSCIGLSPEVAIQVEKSDGTYSNLSNFIYTNETAGPGLCQVNPICGTQGTTVTLSGENIAGAGPYSVGFRLGLAAPFSVAPVAGSWNNPVDTVRAVVPNLDNAEDYKVNLTNANGASNAMPFDVPCGGVPRVKESRTCSFLCVGGANVGKSCNDPGDCPGGACLPAAIPSPNPYKGTTNVCLNAVFGANFVNSTGADVQMDNGTLSNANIKLYDCTDNTAACATTNEIVIPAANFTTYAPPNNVSFTFAPPANLTDNHYYKVIISKEVRSAPPGNVKMSADYQWVVKTQVGTAACPVTQVLVSPPGTTILTEIDPAPGSTQVYSSLPLGPACMFMNPLSYAWTWASSNLPVATLAQVPPQPPYQRTATALSVGQTIISAATEGKTGQARLRVSLDACAFNPGVCAAACPGSVCNIAKDKCTPVTKKISPTSGVMSPNAGQPGTTVTIEGCYFGPYVAGVSKVLFDTFESIFFCPKPWTDSQIITTVPPDILVPPIVSQIMAVYMQTSDGLVSDPGIYGTVFEVNSTCGIGIPVPGTGVPGICSINPSSGKNGSQTSFDGYNFTLNGAWPVVKAQFTEDGGGLVDAADGKDDGTGKLFSGVTVPGTAITGPANVAVQSGVGYCASNSLTFGITCDNSAQCGTGCCAYSSLVHAKICQPLAVCSTGGPGDPCKLDSAEHQAAGLCQLGPTVSGTGDYRCIDPVGHLWPTGLGSPAINSRLYVAPDPAAASPCISCCDPDVDNDGNNEDPQVNLGGLKCTPDQDACTGDERGLYCGCSYDAANPAPGDVQCDDGTGTIACGKNTCCYARPQFISVAPAVPVPPNSLMCLNNVFEFTFDQPIDIASVIPGTSVFMVDDDTGVDLDVSVTRAVNGFIISPKIVFVAGHDVRITLNRDLIRSAKGIAWAGGNQQWTWPISISATVCAIDSFHWHFIRQGAPLILSPLQDNYNCFTDTCADDMSPGAVLGNQHWAVVRALDKYGHGVGATYNWSTGDGTIVKIDETLHTNVNQGLTAQPKNGRTTVRVEAVPNFFTGPKTSSARVTVNSCEKPWPNALAPDFDASQYVDNVTNFSVSYCREPGNLPQLVRPASVIVKPGSYVSDNEKNELIREFFFLRRDASSDDAIGIRVYENEGNQSAREWYFSQFGPAAPQPQDLQVDGYGAVRAGRSVYVAAWNPSGTNDGDPLYPNIYLISYNEGAAEDTVEIYNRMINNWEFSVNLYQYQKEDVQRDMQRVTDLSAIYDKLLKYRTDKGSFPKLEGGSYVKMLTTSKWPSWQDTLGAAVGGDLPGDPIDKFVAAAPPTLCSQAGGYDQNTCWNDTVKKYQCPADSFVYQYMSNAAGNNASLFAHLEGAHINNAGDWFLGDNVGQDYCVEDFGYCSDAQFTTRTTCAAPAIWTPIAECPCFNYDFNVSGTAADHAGPVIDSVDSLIKDATTTVSGTRALDVTVSDAGSGVNQVEFYVDGIRTFTDTDNASWSWNFDTTRYADGSHTVRVRAFDNAGNQTDQDYAIRVDNTSQPDTTRPFVTITAPANGATVSNRNVTYSPDKAAAAAGANSIEATNSGSLFWIDYRPGFISSINRYDSNLTANTPISTLEFPLPSPLDLSEGNGHIYWVRQDKSNGDMLVTYTPPLGRRVVRYAADAKPGDPPKAVYEIPGVIGGVPIPGWMTGSITHAVGAADGKIIAVIRFRILVIFNPTSGLTEKYYSVPTGDIGGIDLDSAGNIYITRYNSRSVDKYSPDLVLIKSLTTLDLNIPIGLDVAGNTIYIANRDNHEIVAMDTDLTKLVHVFGETGTAGDRLSQLNQPTDVVLNGNNLYITDIMNARIVRVRATISNGVQINALATDNRAVQSVDLEVRDSASAIVVDSYSCGGNTTSTLSCSFAPPWDSTTVPNGAYAISAIATDSGGWTGSTSITVNVDNLESVAPTVVFNEVGGMCGQGTCRDAPNGPCDYINPCPNNGICDFNAICSQSNMAACLDSLAPPGDNICLRSGTVNVPVTATDNKSVAEVKFYVDGLFRSNAIHQPGYCASAGTACANDSECTAPDTCALNTWNWSWSTAGLMRGICASHCQAGLQACVSDSDCPQSGDTCAVAVGSGVQCNEDAACQAGLTCAGHRVAAYAYDDSGNVSASTLFIPIDVAWDDSQAPTVAFIPPTPDDNISVVTNPITLAVDAQDDYGVNRVNFYRDHVLMRTVLAGDLGGWVWTVNTANISSGWHSFQVDALDARGNRSTSIERKYNIRGLGGPVITDAAATPCSGIAGTSFTIQVRLADSEGVDTTPLNGPKALIQSPDESNVNIIIINLGRISGDEKNGVYEGTWTSTANDPYFVDIVAQDINGNASELENIECVECLHPPVIDETGVTLTGLFNWYIPATHTITVRQAQAFTATLRASNYPTNWSINTGAPSLSTFNITFDTGTGRFSGTPLNMGFKAGIGVTASNACGDSAPINYNIDINAAACSTIDGYCPVGCNRCRDTDCLPTTCAGCCNGTTCTPSTVAQCGLNSAVCVACPAGQTCNAGVCVAPACSPATCPGGCCTAGGTCVPYASQSNAQCGPNGLACAACGAPTTTCDLSNGSCVAPACSPATCPGGCCTAGGTCVPYASQSNAQCGTGGALCAACPVITPICNATTGGCCANAAIIPQFPPAASSGTAYSYVIARTGTEPLTWAITAGSVPGLTLNTGTGEYSGTPTTGIYTVTFTAVGNAPCAAVATRILTFVINPVCSIYAGTFEGFVFRSTDNGNSWTNSNGGSPIGAGTVLSLIQASNGWILGGGETSLIRGTINNGGTWFDIGNISGAQEYYKLIRASDGSIYAGTGLVGGDVFRSTDNGNNWVNTGELLGASKVHSLLQASDGSLYAGTEWFGDVFRSTDNGNSWVNTGELLGQTGVHSLLQASDGSIYAGTRLSGDVFRTTDNGNSWVNTGDLPFAQKVYSLLQASDGSIYAGTDPVGDVFRSTDNGNSWVNTGNLPGATRVFSLLQASDGSIFAGTQPLGEVFRTTDNGNSWVNTGDLPGAGLVMVLKYYCQ
ncbi:MAG: Ig-like domain-containing protein [Patescibacteria group bacterium]